MNIKHAHEWFRTVVEAGATSLLDDKRGKYKREEFYEMYPEIKLSATAFALENANKKAATFTVKSLANFVTKEFEKITNIPLKPGELINTIFVFNTIFVA